jgi:hypothetical protein
MEYAEPWVIPLQRWRSDFLRRHQECCQTYRQGGSPNDLPGVPQGLSVSQQQPDLREQLGMPAGISSHPFFPHRPGPGSAGCQTSAARQSIFGRTILNPFHPGRLFPGLTAIKVDKQKTLCMILIVFFRTLGYACPHLLPTLLRKYSAKKTRREIGTIRLTMKNIHEGEQK